MKTYWVARKQDGNITTYMAYPRGTTEQFDRAERYPSFEAAVLMCQMGNWRSDEEPLFKPHIIIKDKKPWLRK